MFNIIYNIFTVFKKKSLSENVNQSLKTYLKILSLRYNSEVKGYFLLFRKKSFYSEIKGILKI